MRKLVFVTLALAFAVAASSCAPVALGIYGHDANSATRQLFDLRVRVENLEREKRGDKTLDVCAERYAFDRPWARTDPDCKDRIDRFERGDLGALETPTLNPWPPSAPQAARRERA